MDEVGKCALITTLQLPGFKIGHNLRPNRLSLSHYHRIAVFLGLIGYHRGMNATHHHRNTQPPVDGGQFISSCSRGGKAGDADEIGLIKTKPLEIFILDFDFPTRRGQRSEDGQAQRLAFGGTVDQKTGP